MTEVATENAFVRFRKTTAAKILAAVLAIAAGILLFYGNAIEWCCVGVLLIGIVVFLVLKIFDVSNFKILIVVGVLFLLASTAVGAVVSKPIIDNGIDSANGSAFGNTEVVTDNGTVTISVRYSGTEDLNKVEVVVGELSFISYKLYNYYGNSSDYSSYAHVMTKDGDRYTCTMTLGTDKVYGFKFIGTYTNDSGESKTVTSSNGLFKNCVSDMNYIWVLLKYNLYYCGLATLMYMMIILFVEWSRRNMEKAKAKMIAEGKYPVGYGRCDQCGGLIVPGEKYCRKCGKEVNEELLKSVKPQTEEPAPVEYFECSDCGARVPADAKVCPKCGAKFDDDEDQKTQ